MTAIATACVLASAAVAQDGGFAPASAQSTAPAPSVGRVRVTVRTIAATNDAATPPVDPRLSAIASHLEPFRAQFRFRSYKLLQEQSFDLDWKSPAHVELPGSRSLQVTPRQLAPDGKIKVHLELLGEHPEHARKLHTDYSIQRGGTILVGGLLLDPRDEKAGTLLIAVTQGMEK